MKKVILFFGVIVIVLVLGISIVKIIEEGDYDYWSHYFDKDYLAFKGMKNSDAKYLLRAIELGEKSTWAYCTLASVYAEDKNDDLAEKYYKKAINKLDTESIKILDSRYIKDKNNVYLECSEIKERDAESFEVLSYFYTKDKIRVFYVDEELKGADTETFTILNSDYAKDKNNVYYNNKKINKADQKTFEAYENYGKDRNNVYYREILMKDADSETFTENKVWQRTEDGIEYMAEDRNNYYAGEEIVKEKDRN